MNYLYPGGPGGNDTHWNVSRGNGTYNAASPTRKTWDILVDHTLPLATVNQRIAIQAIMDVFGRNTFRPSTNATCLVSFDAMDAYKRALDALGGGSSSAAHKQILGMIPSVLYADAQGILRNIRSVSPAGIPDTQAPAQASPVSRYNGTPGRRTSVSNSLAVERAVGMDYSYEEAQESLKRVARGGQEVDFVELLEDLELARRAKTGNFSSYSTRTDGRLSVTASTGHSPGRGASQLDQQRRQADNYWQMHYHNQSSEIGSKYRQIAELEDQQARLQQAAQKRSADDRIRQQREYLEKEYARKIEADQARFQSERVPGQVNTTAAPPSKKQRTPNAKVRTRAPSVHDVPVIHALEGRTRGNSAALIEKGIMMSPAKVAPRMQAMVTQMEHKISGDRISKMLATRPEVSDLVDHNVLQSPTRVAPAIHDAQRKLERNMVSDNVRRSLSERKSVGELVQCGVLPAESVPEEVWAPQANAIASIDKDVQRFVKATELERKLSERPGVDELKSKNIYREEGYVPITRRASEAIEPALQHRPAFDDLVNRNIVPAGSEAPLVSKAKQEISKRNRRQSVQEALSKRSSPAALAQKGILRQAPAAASSPQARSLESRFQQVMSDLDDLRVRKEKLSAFIKARPNIDELVNKNVVGDRDEIMSPNFAMARKRLRESIDHDHINNHLRSRPSIDEVVRKGIINQFDARATIAAGASPVRSTYTPSYRPPEKKARSPAGSAVGSVSSVQAQASPSYSSVSRVAPPTFAPPAPPATAAAARQTAVMSPMGSVSDVGRSKYRIKVDVMGATILVPIVPTDTVGSLKHAAVSRGAKKVPGLGQKLARGFHLFDKSGAAIDSDDEVGDVIDDGDVLSARPLH